MFVVENPRLIPISELMKNNVPGIGAAAVYKFGNVPIPKSKYGRSMIETGHLCGFDILYCFEASRHRDAEYGWSALWPVLFNGHHMHMQAKRGGEIIEFPMTASNIVLFHAGQHWHWTSLGQGILLVAPAEFGDDCPSDEQVLASFDRQLTAYLANTGS